MQKRKTHTPPFYLAPSPLPNVCLSVPLCAAILSLFLVLTLARLVALSDNPTNASGGEPQGLEIITASTGFAALTGRRRAPSDKSVGKAGASGAGASIDYLPVAKAAGTPVKKPTNPAAPWLDE